MLYFSDKNLKYQRYCEELTAGGRLICAISAVPDAVTHPGVRDTLSRIAAELVWRAGAIRYNEIS